MAAGNYTHMHEPNYLVVDRGQGWQQIIYRSEQRNLTLPLTLALIWDLPLFRWASRYETAHYQHAFEMHENLKFWPTKVQMIQAALMSLTIDGSFIKYYH